MAGFERAFRKFLSGLYVITVRDGDRVNGMTAAWAMRASFKPPLVAVSIGKTRYSHDMIKRAGAFAVNVLAEGQVETGRHFGRSSGRDTDKFEDMDFDTAHTGAPLLKGVAAYLDCTLWGASDAGDHTIFIGEVKAAEVFRGKEPLPYRREDFF